MSFLGDKQMSVDVGPDICLKRIFENICNTNVYWISWWMNMFVSIVQESPCNIGNIKVF